jgi:hypothetical protein
MRGVGRPNRRAFGPKKGIEREREKNKLFIFQFLFQTYFSNTSSYF